MFGEFKQVRRAWFWRWIDPPAPQCAEAYLKQYDYAVALDKCEVVKEDQAMKD